MNSKYKLLLIFFAFLLLIFSVFSIEAEEETYTRAQMQEMIVSTALSYFYNNSYSDYSQLPMDKVSDGGSYATGTYYHRNLSMSPEDVSRGNYYKIDCSGFAFLSYFNTFGYDASKYSNINNYTLFNSNQMIKVNSFSNTIDYHRLAYNKFGQAWNNLYLVKMINSISETCSDASCSSSTANGIVYNNMNNSRNNELAYYYYTQEYKNPNTLKQEWNKIRNELQPGDIILINLYPSKTGHVMLYVGEDEKIGADKYLIHSTGVDSEYLDSSNNNKLFKNKSIVASVVASSEKDYIHTRIDNADGVDTNGDKKYLRLFAVIRPINTMCINDSNCKIGRNVNNVALSSEKLSNTKARVELSDYRFEQFATAFNDNGESYNILNNNNSVNAGNVIRYNLQITNKSKSKGPTITIVGKIPTNSVYVEGSCTNNCIYDESSKTITWKNVSINELATYRYKARPIKDGQLENEGMIVKTENNTLKLGKIKVTVGATFNTSNSNKFEQEINKFKTAVANGKINYSTGIGDYLFELDGLSEVKNVSQASFIKLIYYNSYGIDLGSLMSNTIKNALFNNIGNGSVNIYSKRTDKEISDSNNATYKEINQMLVPGMYGGVKLKGNDNNDRIKNLRSYKLYGLEHSSDLQVGDIIISYYDNSTYIKSYFVTSFDENGPILSMLKSNLSIINYNNEYLSPDDTSKAYYNNVGSFSQNRKPSEQILNELFNQDLFVVLRPSRLFGTTIIKNNNNVLKTYIAYDKYKDLDIPTRTGYTFHGWYSDTNFNNEINNNTKLVSSKSHNIYAKWVVNTYTLTYNAGGGTVKPANKNIEYNAEYGTLPIPTKSGYIFDGWYTVSSGGEKVETTTKMKDGNVTIFAQWKKNNLNPIIELKDEYKVKGNLITNISLGETVNTLDLGLSDGYKFKIYNKNDKEKNSNELLATGDKIRIYLESEMLLEYIIVVKGDVTGSGKVTISDVSKLYQYLKGKTSMEECYIEAGNVVGETTEIRINDVAKIYQFIKNKIESWDVK